MVNRIATLAVLLMSIGLVMGGPQKNTPPTTRAENTTKATGEAAAGSGSGSGSNSGSGSGSGSGAAAVTGVAVAEVPSPIPDLSICCPAIPIILKNETIHNCKNTGKSSCASECSFKDEHLLTPDGKAVNMENLNKQIDSLVVGEWTSAMMDEVKNTCTKTLPVVEKSAACQSGACEVLKCVNKFLLSKCTGVVGSPECNKAKEEFEKMCSSTEGPSESQTISPDKIKNNHGRG